MRIRHPRVPVVKKIQSRFYKHSNGRVSGLITRPNPCEMCKTLHNIRRALQPGALTRGAISTRQLAPKFQIGTQATVEDLGATPSLECSKTSDLFSLEDQKQEIENYETNPEVQQQAPVESKWSMAGLLREEWKQEKVDGIADQHGGQRHEEASPGKPGAPGARAVFARVGVEGEFHNRLRFRLRNHAACLAAHSSREPDKAGGCLRWRGRKTSSLEQV